MERVHAWRALMLAKHITRSVPPEEFAMEQWYCGTAACALGHAATMTEFKPHLRVFISKPEDERDEDEPDFYPVYSPLTNPELARLKRLYKKKEDLGFNTGISEEKSGFLAGSRFFGVSFKDSVQTFSPETYPGIRSNDIDGNMVANRLREYATKSFPGLVAAFDRRYS